MNILGAVPHSAQKVHEPHVDQLMLTASKGHSGVEARFGQIPSYPQIRNSHAHTREFAVELGASLAKSREGCFRVQLMRTL